MVCEEALHSRTMQASQRACITFSDVAASFSEDEWEVLEQWQRDLYSNVMQEIHTILLDLGYHIKNSKILFRIVREDDPSSRVHRECGTLVEGVAPDILLQINYQGKAVNTSELDDSDEGSIEVKSERVYQKIKVEDELDDDLMCDSQTREPSPVCEVAQLPQDLEVKHELNVIVSEPDDVINPRTPAEEISAWKPIEVRVESRSPSSGDTPEPTRRDRIRRRKGIARKMKPVAALHDSDQNKQTEPKANEIPRVPCLFSQCESSFTNLKMTYPPADVSGDYSYTAFAEGFVEESPISFQQRGQTFIICSVCGKTFCNNSSFQVHMRTHTGERPYKCTNCEKSFIRSSHLKIHLRTHTGERPYKCSECEKSFRDNSSFARHQRIHTGEKPYQCGTCGKYFRKKSNLKDHQRTHTGERPYKCKHCDKSFHQKSNLRVHEKNHHGEDY
ncbi:zinc finger 883-like [Pelobates cultripes]|uniref:Zinc finger 883-like n=1 Tax=Pelobates cultripes TaxID=61616 RepID=A0AAD1R924_PELCU|nr:zinc finger 883-like [Pelobates cultripes]